MNNNGELKQRAACHHTGLHAGQALFPDVKRALMNASRLKRAEIICQRSKKMMRERSVFAPADLPDTAKTELRQ